MRKLLLTAGVVVAAVLAIGINRIVVTDGRIDAVAMHARPNDAQVVASSRTTSRSSDRRA